MIKGVDFNELYSLYEAGGMPRGKSTGWTTLDPLYTVRAGEVTVITGIPGHGKSSWLDNVVINTAQDHGFKWLIFSGENRPIVRHCANLASIYIGRPFNDTYGRMSQEDLTYATAFLDEHIQFLDPSYVDCNLNSMLINAELIKGLNCMVLDPWNYLDHARPEKLTETEFIKHSLVQVGDFAKRTGVHVFMVAHPKMLNRSKEDGSYPVPTLYDVSGSAHWRNIVDNGVVVWRDMLDPTSATQIHVQKIRFREVGCVGMGRLFYDPITGRYNDPLTGARPKFDVKAYRIGMDAKLAEFQAEIEAMEERLAIQEGQ